MTKKWWRDMVLEMKLISPKNKVVGSGETTEARVNYCREKWYSQVQK